MSNWLPQLTSIDDPIADDYWSHENDEGVQRVSRVTIGRPESPSPTTQAVTGTAPCVSTPGSKEFSAWSESVPWTR
jgi:hypothetical protein